MTQTAKTSKNMKTQIVARYFIKRNGHVVYAVRSSNGKDLYHMTIINGKATGCTCPSYKPCYHMTQLEEIETERTASATSALCEWLNGFAAALQPVSLEQVVEQEVQKCQQARENVKLAPIAKHPQTAKEWRAAVRRPKQLDKALREQYRKSAKVVRDAQEVA